MHNILLLRLQAVQAPRESIHQCIFVQKSPVIFRNVEIQLYNTIWGNANAMGKRSLQHYILLLAIFYCSFIFERKKTIRAFKVLIFHFAQHQNDTLKASRSNKSKQTVFLSCNIIRGGSSSSMCSSQRLETHFFAIIRYGFDFNSRLYIEV